MGDYNDGILDWFHLSFVGKHRRFQLEQSSDVTFHVSNAERKLMTKLSSPLTGDVTSNYYIPMDNSLDNVCGFWPLKPRLITHTPEPIDDAASRTNVKERALRPFSDQWK